MKKHILFILLIVCSVIGFHSCQSGNSVMKINNDIDSDTRKQIAELNKKLFTGIMAKDINGVKSLLSDELLKKAGSRLDTLINTSAQTFNTKNYEILDEFYTKHHVGAAPDTLRSERGNESDYVISFKAMNPEMYTSLLVTKGLSVNALILAIYGKYGNDWKINVLQIGEYSIEGKIAPDFYHKANDYLREGSLVDASNMMLLTSELGNPVGDFFKYKTEDTMRMVYSTIINEANGRFQFPVTIKGLPTKPQIFSVSPQFVDEAADRGIYPLIKYKTAVKITDLAALTAENNQVQSVIGSLFQGIDKNKKHILYQAYDQFPDGKTIVHHYAFVQNIKQN